MGEYRYILMEEVTKLCNNENPNNLDTWLKDNSLIKDK